MLAVQRGFISECANQNFSAVFSRSDILIEKYLVQHRVLTKNLAVPNFQSNLFSFFFFFFITTLKIPRKKSINTTDYRLKAVFPQGTSADTARNTTPEEKIF